MNRKLYVGNIPYETTENDLETLFAAAGTVESVQVMRDRESGRARGFAFVQMATDDEAGAAVNTLNESSYGGRSLTVNIARPQAERSFGGGRGERRSEPRW
jgi:RNA recognition motif-containing protein